MSVVESGVVDGIGLADNETMKMLITDHLDWQDEYQHLLMLQEKINSYIGFCESGQYHSPEGLEIPRRFPGPCPLPHPVSSPH